MRFGQRFSVIFGDFGGGGIRELGEQLIGGIDRADQV